MCVYGINGSGVVEGERLGCSKTKVCVEWAGEQIDILCYKFMTFNGGY